MKHILVPIDFSQESQNAIKTAARLAKKFDSTIYLMHMFSLPSGVVEFSSAPDPSNPSIALYLKKIHEKFGEIKQADFLKGVKVHEEVRFHKTFSGIISYSKELNADFIVMGSSGASGIDEIFVGSNTERVVRNSDIPVLVVKEEFDVANLKRIVFASDFKDEAKPSLERLLNFTKYFDIELDFLFVNTIHNFERTKETSKRLKEFILGVENMPKEYTLNVYNDTSIERGILNFSQDVQADLIAVNTHQRKGLASLYVDSVAEDIVNHAIKPVLTFKL